MVNRVWAPDAPAWSSMCGDGMVVHISFAYIYLTKEGLLATPDLHRLGLPNPPLGTGHHEERLKVLEH